jgi:hypothetical protein
MLIFCVYILKGAQNKGFRAKNENSFEMGGFLGCKGETIDPLAAVGG